MVVFALIRTSSTISLFLLGLILENTSLLGTIHEGLLVHRLVLLLEGDHSSINDRIMLQRHWSLLSVLDVDLLLFDTSNPLGELEVVGDSGGQHDDTDCVRKLDDDLFPH